MRWIDTRLVRCLKTVIFGFIWSLSLSLTYQSLMVYQEVSGPFGSTDSPATLAESIVKTCLSSGDPSISASMSGDRVVVLGRRSPRMAEFIHQILLQGAQVMVIAESEVFVHLRRWSSDDVIPDRLIFVDMEHQCTTAERLNVTWRQFQAKTVHLFFDEFDFSDVDFASDLSSILSCIVNTFQNVALMKDVSIFEHSSRHRHIPRIGIHYNTFTMNSTRTAHQHLMESSSADPLATRQGKVPRNHKVNSCDPLYDYDFYADVFMKTVNIITKTYANLYKLESHNVIHPS